MSLRRLRRGGSRAPVPPPPPQESPDEHGCEPPAEDESRDDGRRYGLEDLERGAPCTRHDVSGLPGRLRWWRARDGLDIQGYLGVGGVLIQVLDPALHHLDLPADGRKLALDRERLLHVLCPIVKPQQALFGGPEITLPGLEIHVFLGHILAADGVGRDLLAQAPQLVEHPLEFRGGDREYELGSKGVAAPVDLRAEDAAACGSGDLLGLRSILADLLCAEAEVSGLDDLAAKVSSRGRIFGYVNLASGGGRAFLCLREIRSCRCGLTGRLAPYRYPTRLRLAAPARREGQNKEHEHALPQEFRHCCRTYAFHGSTSLRRVPPAEHLPTLTGPSSAQPTPCTLPGPDRFPDLSSPIPRCGLLAPSGDLLRVGGPRLLSSRAERGRGGACPQKREGVRQGSRSLDVRP